MYSILLPIQKPFNIILEDGCAIVFGDVPQKNNNEILCDAETTILTERAIFMIHLN